MTGRVQTLRSNTSGNRPPGGHQPGELYVNWADSQIGVVNSTGSNQDFVAVRFFSTAANYVIGDFVVQGGNLWRAIAASSAGAFVPANWIQSGGSVSVGDTPPVTPQAGGLWFDSVGGQLYVWYVDPNTSQWVPATNQVGGGYATTAYVNSLPVIGDNRVINGDMRIDQRNGGAGGTVVNTYTVDRWFYAASQASKGTWGRYTGGPSWLGLGWGYYLGFTSSSAYASIAADTFNFAQKIEAEMISDFAWGTANAQPVTLSFFVASSLGGAFSGSLANTDGSRSYPFSFSLTASTITKIIVTIPGDTGGTWTLQGNGVGLFVRFDLGAGSSNRGPAGAWASANYVGVTGSVSVVGTNGATFFISGVKLEIGSVATPYNRQSLAKSMADCQRYYQTGNVFVGGYSVASGTLWSASFLPVTMRAAPTVAFSGSNVSNASAITLNSATVSTVNVQTMISPTGTGWSGAQATFSAEL